MTKDVSLFPINNIALSVLMTSGSVNDNTWRIMLDWYKLGSSKSILNPLFRTVSLLFYLSNANSWSVLCSSIPSLNGFIGTLRLSRVRRDSRPKCEFGYYQFMKKQSSSCFLVLLCCGTSIFCPFLSEKSFAIKE